MTNLKLIFSNCSQITALMMIVGAIAWIIKLIVIILTNGRIINTGAAAFFMATGLFMLIIGSTGIGFSLTKGRNTFLRVLAILLSPAVVFGSFVLFGMITNPMFNGSSISYAQEEAPIGLAVIVYLFVGYFLINEGNATAEQQKVLYSHPDLLKK